MSLKLDDLVGNTAIRNQLTIANGAARLNNAAMGHTLLTGLAGTGKTTTAKALANLSQLPFFPTSAEGLRSAEDIAALFSKFPDDGYNPYTGEKVGTIYPPIIFVDEAHRMTLRTEEMLGIAMENWTHTYTVGRGRKKETITTWVPEFTVVCATTKEGKLSKPFRERFKYVFVFGSYSVEESEQIVRLHADKNGISIDATSVRMIAQRGRGTPRLLVKLLDNVYDSMRFMGRTAITPDLAETQFRLSGIDSIGLTETDVAILKDLYSSEVPVGLDSLAVRTNLDPVTISEVNEPHLIRLGFIERSKSGRIITDKGEKHLIKHGYVEPPTTDLTSARVLKRG